MTGDEVARVILRGLKLWVALLEQALGIEKEESDDDMERIRQRTTTKNKS